MTPAAYGPLHRVHELGELGFCDSHLATHRLEHAEPGPHFSVNAQTSVEQTRVESDVESWRQRPGPPLLVILKRMVTTMIIRIGGENVEDHSARDFPKFGQRHRELQGRAKQVEVIEQASRARVVVVHQAGKRVKMNSAGYVASRNVETLHEQMKPLFFRALRNHLR